ncbi:sensor domain-containing diguanylate cyclase [Undibacterium luofuense]|uniref:Sensor domain-containing diguanylate cyclase n=1 Tax=Undibacterium luofuense TaxID=2828733 RepID=A0A941I5D6_9BURK|nr:sensor domain-containing diguanylate cyclase [Undibacterium luofuense]MBR7782682.1 sensor domain-containing diguanylate cyclase [Undibacterium luofuense]
MDIILKQLAQSLNEARSIEQLVRPLLEMLSSATGMESTYLTSIEFDDDTQTVKYARNVGNLQIPEGIVVSWGDSLCKRSLESCISATSDVQELWSDSEAAKNLGICSYMTVPIVCSGGKLMGTLCAASAEKVEQQQKARTVLQLFGNIVANFLEREILISELQETNRTLQRIALTDLLTDLPNRRAMIEQLERILAHATRYGTSTLIGMIDLDNFKYINDEYGHRVGDQFLREIARRLADCLRATDFLGRLGGDEFLFVGFGPSPKDQQRPVDVAAMMQNRLTKATEGKFDLGEVSINYGGASVAVIVLDADTSTCEKAIEAADDAMYRVKQQRKLALAH